MQNSFAVFITKFFLSKSLYTEFLSLKENQLNGTLPHEIEELTMLKELLIGKNALTGHLHLPIADDLGEALYTL